MIYQEILDLLSDMGFLLNGVDLDKLLLLGRVDHDVNVDLFINNRKVGTGFISASITNKSITIPIKNNTSSNLITI